MDINLARLSTLIERIKSAKTQIEKVQSFERILQIVEVMKWDKNYNLDVPETED